MRSCWKGKSGPCALCSLSASRWREEGSVARSPARPLTSVLLTHHLLEGLLRTCSSGGTVPPPSSSSPFTTSSSSFPFTAPPPSPAPPPTPPPSYRFYIYICRLLFLLVLNVGQCCSAASSELENLGKNSVQFNFFFLFLM